MICTSGCCARMALPRQNAREKPQQARQCVDKSTQAHHPPVLWWYLPTITADKIQPYHHIPAIRPHANTALLQLFHQPDNDRGFSVAACSEITNHDNRYGARRRASVLVYSKDGTRHSPGHTTRRVAAIAAIKGIHQTRFFDHWPNCIL